MKKSIIATVLVSLGFAIPVFTTQAADSASTMNSGGGNFTECAAIRMKEITLKQLGDGKVTKVPEGWTVVSGSGGQGHPKLLICR